MFCALTGRGSKRWSEIAGEGGGGGSGGSG